jgi:hypothetical protein
MSLAVGEIYASRALGRLGRIHLLGRVPHHGQLFPPIPHRCELTYQLVLWAHAWANLPERALLPAASHPLERVAKAAAALQLIVNSRETPTHVDGLSDIIHVAAERIRARGESIDLESADILFRLLDPGSLGGDEGLDESQIGQSGWRRPSGSGANGSEEIRSGTPNGSTATFR